MMAEERSSNDPRSGIDLVVEVRGVEQGNRPVSVSFRGITVKPGGDNGGLATFEGPYEVLSPPGSKALEVSVEAPIFVGLIAHAFVPADGLLSPYDDGRVPSIWELAECEVSLTVTTRFFGYKPGSDRSQAQVGLSQLTGRATGSPHAATHLTGNLHFWSPPDFPLTFEDARVVIQPAGQGRLALSAEYSWNQGEWTAKSNGLFVLDGNALGEALERSTLNTGMSTTVEEKKSDNSDGVLTGTVSGRITRS
jgi:hypothetical protein